MNEGWWQFSSSDKIRNDLQQMKSEMGNMSEKLDSLKKPSQDEGQ